MIEKIISEINGKIEELKKLVKIYEEKSRFYLIDKNERIKAGESENDNEINIIQIYSDIYMKISEIISSRAHEANNIIKSMEAPNDPAERVHANTSKSDEQIIVIREYIIERQKFFDNKNQLIELRENIDNELKILIENQNFELKYKW